MKQIQTNIYRRRHGKDKVSWMVRWKDQNTGHWKAFTAGRTRDEALIIESKVRQELLKDIDPSPIQKTNQADLTVSNVIELYFKHSKFLTRTKRNQKEDRLRLDGIFRPEIGNSLFKDLKSDKIYKFYLKTKERRNLCNATISKYHFLLCRLGDVYAETTPDGINPIRRIQDFSKAFPNEAATRDINFLTPEEIEKVHVELAKSPCRLAAPFIKFLAHTGLRRSEASELKWTDIDEGAGLIYIRDSKTGKSRILPLEQEALNAIKYLKGRGKFIFMTPRGVKLKPHSIIRPLKKAVKRASINKRVDIHTFRHSYGSNKIRQGWGLKKVFVLLGHSNITVTANIYTHLLDGDLRVRDDFYFENNAKQENSITETLNLVLHKLNEISEKILDQTAIKTIVKQILEDRNFIEKAESQLKNG